MGQKATMQDSGQISEFKRNLCLFSGTPYTLPLGIFHFLKEL